MRIGERGQQILTGLITLTLLSALVVFGVRVANGALRPRYQLEASFAAAGQGLIHQSDVKIHGVNIGRVKSVRLEDGRARVRMDIDKGQRVPVEAKATIRPKTLFGEKFVDVEPGPREFEGPFLPDEGVIEETLGGFELEKVLTDAYPILKAIDPEELAVLVDTLARSAEGTGEKVNRQIANFKKLAEVQARHDADTRQFLDDFAALTEELARRAPDLVAGAEDLNAALPDLNARSAELAALLDQGARLSADLADLLEANRPFLENSVTEGGKAIQLLYEERDQIPPLVVGLRQFLQVLAEVGRIPFGDGTNLAAVKFVIGEDEPCGRVPGGCAGPQQPANAARPGAAAGPAPTPGGSGGAPVVVPPVDRLPAPTSGAAAVLAMATRTVPVRGGR